MSLKYLSSFQKFISIFCSLVYKISLLELQQETELLGLVSKMETGLGGGGWNYLPKWSNRSLGSWKGSKRLRHSANVEP